MALILLLTWPFISTMFYRDPTFVLSGSLIHMAMQCGLHTPYLRMESLKVDPILMETNNIKKAQIWAYVAITYQR